MNRGDFKEITKVHFETCKKLIEQKGDCSEIGCDNCPFDSNNSYNCQECFTNGYCQRGEIESDNLLIESCKQFLTYDLDLGYEGTLIGLITIGDSCQFAIELDIPVNVGELIQKIEECLAEIDDEYTFHVGTITQLSEVFFKHGEDMKYKFKIRQLLAEFKFAL